MARFPFMIRRLRLHALALLVVTVACDSPARARATEGRLAADASYGRFETGSSAPAADAAAAAELLENRVGSVEDAAKGRAFLVLKRPEAAVSALSIAAAESQDPSVANDLAVALLAVAPRDGGLKVDMLALDAAARALRLARSEAPASLFNFAVAAGRIGLGPAAVQALDRLEFVEKSPRWRSEATSRRDVLSRDVENDRRRAGGDMQSARETFFSTRLPELGRALLASSAVDEPELSRLAEQADTLSGGRDTFAADCVAALKHAASARAELRRQVAEALIAQGHGLRLYASAEYERADAAFSASTPVLDHLQPCG